MTSALRHVLLSLLAFAALMVGVGALPSEEVSSKPQQWEGQVAGPDLSPYSRDLQKGEIVGRPPADRSLPTTPTPPPLQPPTTPPGLSVSPPPQLPLQEVSGFQPLQRLFDDGSLIPVWTGQGRVAGEMLELSLQNTTDGPIAIMLEPGMVLELTDPLLAAEFQPVMLESESTFLVPAQGKVSKLLRGYCLDYELLPPAAGRAFPYRFPESTIAYAPAMEVLEASLTYDAEENVLPVDRQRTVIIQRAVWAALGQTDKQKLYEDILKDAAAEGKTISKKRAQRLADVLWDEVQKLLNQAQ